ncbi:DUF397 domain-containing protein [Streptomyces qinzhouensis]|uniref:DUF397 domain-containing protein n=1 Tax=Streptomyces qinzhouensis TaxID=2599401 RepID=A0A5B8JBI2_9ACTN|nr:DUF397 domain-containing protein [Streptomyces qinzhouensis]QDY78686.1 DUF397 domain-containing protein [Streptomyces qinzhouensis]
MSREAHGEKWFKSSYSNGNGNCVEVRIASAAVAMRDSKVTQGPAVMVAGATWSSFLGAVKSRHLR